MRLFRKTLFWIHLAIGIAAGIVILILSVTGVLLTYQHQMTNWADARTYTLASTSGPRLSIDAALAIAKSEAGAEPTNVVVRNDPEAALEVAFGRERILLVDPYRGRVLGSGATATRTFFRVVTNVHRTFGWRNPGGRLRHEIVRVSNLLFLVQVITGLYLWFPRRLAWPQFRSVLLFRRKVTGRARDFNWHNVIGFWMLFPLFIIVITGVVMSYPWANALLYRAAGSPLPQQNARAGASGQEQRAGRSAAPGIPNPDRAGSTPEANANRLDTLFAAAKQQSREWRVISFRPPTPAASPVTFTVESGIRGRPDKRAQWTFAGNGRLVKKEAFADNSLGRQMRMWVRFGHTGEVGGVPGQTLAGIASAGACVLVITGFALSLRRFNSWVGRSRESRPAIVESDRESVEDFARRT